MVDPSILGGSPTFRKSIAINPRQNAITTFSTVRTPFPYLPSVGISRLSSSTATSRVLSSTRPNETSTTKGILPSSTHASFLSTRSLTSSVGNQSPSSVSNSTIQTLSTAFASSNTSATISSTTLSVTETSYYTTTEMVFPDLETTIVITSVEDSYHPSRVSYTLNSADPTSPSFTSPTAFFANKPAVIVCFTVLPVFVFTGMIILILCVRRRQRDRSSWRLGTNASSSVTDSRLSFMDYYDPPSTLQFPQPTMQYGQAWGGVGNSAETGPNRRSISLRYKRKSGKGFEQRQRVLSGLVEDVYEDKIEETYTTDPFGRKFTIPEIRVEHYHGEM